MKKTIYIAIALVFCWSCANELEEDSVVEVAAEKEQQEEADLSVVPGELVLYLDEATANLIESDVEAGLVKTKSGELNLLCDELGITSIERLFPAGGPHDAIFRKRGMHRYYVVRYSATKAPTKAAEIAEVSPCVDLAETVEKVRLRGFNDPLLKYQWHYYNSVVAGADINVKPVWENYTTGSSNVIVCVVDEGVDYTHEDLAANMWTDSNGKHGWNFVTNTSNITWNNDGDEGHGTHVAGTVAAINNNGKGVCGVAGGDFAAGVGGVKIMSSQIFSGDDGSSTYYTARAIAYGEEHGAVISQNSWGYYADTNDDGYVSPQEENIYKNKTVSSYLKEAISSFIENAGCDSDGKQLDSSPMKGGVVFFAAGNEDINYDLIGVQCPDVISVGAFGPTGEKASYSCYGDWVDIAAPGGDSDVDFTINNLFQPGIYSLGRNNEYTYRDKILYQGQYYWAYWQGTSMACPHASGVAALAVSYFGGPGFTADMLREAMIEGSDPDYFPSGTKIGRKVDALGIFEYLGGGQPLEPGPPAAPSSYTVSAKSNAVTFSLNVTMDYKRDPVASYVLLLSKIKSTLSATDPASPGDGVIAKTVAVTGAVGTAFSASIDNLDFAAKYYAAIAAVDSEGRYSVLSSIKEVSTGANHAPKITTDYTDSFIFASTASVDIPFSITDSDGHEVTVDFTTDGKATFSQSGDTWHFLLDATKETQNVAIAAKITATDAYGLSAEYPIEYKVLPPEPPAAPQVTTTIVMNEITFKWNSVKDCFENDVLNYKVFLSKSKAHIQNLNPANPVEGIITQAVSLTKAGSATAKISSLEFDTQYYAAVLACDKHELWTNNYSVLEPHTQVNHAPVITIDYQGDGVFMHNEKKSIPVTITDPDNQTVSVKYSTTGGAILSGSGSSRTIVINGSSEPQKDTPQSLTITATDLYGLQTEATFNYKVLSNRAPILEKEFQNHVINGFIYHFAVTPGDYFSDPDGDAITYYVSSDNAAVKAEVGDNSIYLSALSAGTATVSVVAKDAGGASTTASFQVLVRAGDSTTPAQEADEEELIVDVYPNPVTKYLYVRGGPAPKEALIRVVSTSGTLVFKDNISISAFNPAVINMVSSSPGQYTVSITSGGQTVKKTVVKR